MAEQFFFNYINCEPYYKENKFDDNMDIISFSREKILIMSNLYYKLNFPKNIQSNQRK